MASLKVHLRQAGDHGRLGFHPECPVCCEERLAGALPSDALISARAPAVLAAGVLAFSYASPAVVLAQEGGQDQGLASDSTTASPGDEVNAGPEDSDETSADPADAADDNDADGTGPVGPDLVTNGDDSAGDPAPATPTAAPAAPTTPAPSVQSAAAAPQAKPLVGAKAPGSVAPATPAPATPAAAAPGSVAAPDGTTPPAAAAPGTAVARDGNERAPARTRVVRRLVHKHRHAPNVAVRSASAPVAPVAPVAAPRPAVTTVAYVAQQVPAPVVVRRAGRSARPGDRVHVVFAGESLWSIAQDVLGAKASVGETAREVDRFWVLNRERIGTGDRDLLPIGTRLVLR